MMLEKKKLKWNERKIICLELIENLLYICSGAQTTEHPRLKVNEKKNTNERKKEREKEIIFRFN